MSSLFTRFRFVRVRCVRTYALLSKPPFQPKPVSHSQQSVLLPGEERIRASALLDDPNETFWKIPGSEHIETAYQMLEHGLKVSNDGDCAGRKCPKSGEYKWLKYSEVMAKSHYIGSGLQELGLKPGTKSMVGMFATNREEYLLTLLGCAAYSFVFIPLYPTLGPQAILFIINQANLSVLLVDCEKNGLKMLSNANKIPSVRTLVMLDSVSPQLVEEARSKNISIILYTELEALGQKHTKPLVLGKPDDLYYIPYTSGTTGIPKGVMLTHKNTIACASSCIVNYGEAGLYGGTILSYLPPAHIYEIVNQLVSLLFARRIAFYTGEIKNLMSEVKQLKPDILPLVPRLMGVIYGQVKEKTRKSFLKSLLLKVALSRKEKCIRRGQMNGSVWDKLVFKEFQEALGSPHMIITTSAPLSSEVMRFFRRASGAYLFEAYGQTEMLAATMTLPRELDGGIVGAPMSCNHVKLADVPEMGYYAKDDIGEVCVRGPNVFQGYYKNEEATRESYIDGWQHTGDVGKWLPNGTLKIVDRKKHLFKLSQGEYIAPEKVEETYARCPLVQQIFIDGFEHQNYIVALVVPEINALKDWLKAKGYKQTEDITQLLSNKDVRREFLQELRNLGKLEELNPLEQAKNLSFLPEPFTVDNDFLTPTMKLKRNHVRKHYKKHIETLYEEGPLL